MTKEKALVIDDNPVIVRMCETLLRSGNYDVVCATDGDRGLKKAREEKPDIILLDIILPQMHGFEICEQLQKDEKTRRIPVVIISGTDLEDVVRQGTGFPKVVYLSKPFGAKDLFAAIEQAKKNSAQS
jgi:CheY-like chemotaxis protein